MADTEQDDSQEDQDESPQQVETEQAEDEGPGWMPALLAGMVLMGIFGFVTCAFSTWLLFQNRTELAIRTCDAYVINLEQSLLQQDSKRAVVEQIDALSKEMQRGKYENWQSAGIMQRLQRLPVIQWGELQAIKSVVSKSDHPNRDDQLKEVSRLQRAVELGKANSFDFEDVLNPVHVADSASPNGHRMTQKITGEHIDEVVSRAKSVADRAGVPNEMFPNVFIETIVRREIEKGANQGAL